MGKAREGKGVTRVMAGGGVWLGSVEGFAKQTPPSSGQGRSMWWGLSIQQTVGAAEGSQRS